MSDELQTEDSRPEIPEVVQRDVDFLLEEFVRCVEVTGSELGITLFAGGMIITGTLISGRKYFEANAQEFRDAGGEMNELFAGLLSSIAKKYPGVPETEDEAVATLKGNDPRDRRRAWIHLKDAHIVVQGPGTLLLPTNGCLWRGSLHSIDGYTFGRWHREADRGKV